MLVERHYEFFASALVLPSFFDNHDMNRFLQVARRSPPPGTGCPAPVHVARTSGDLQRHGSRCDAGTSRVSGWFAQGGVADADRLRCQPGW